MSTYSIPGYVAVAVIRSSATILTEGPTDSKTIKQLIGEVASRLKRKIAISVDSAAIIRSPKATLGNREKVEEIHRLAGPTSRDKLACWVDREHRNFAVAAELRDELPHHNVVDKSLFWTRGHSVENYFLHAPYFESFLRIRLPDIQPPEVLERCGVVLQSATRCSAGLCIAASECSCLDRMRGLVQVSDWQINGSDASLDPATLYDRLHHRGIDRPLADKMFQRAAEVEALNARPAGTHTQVGQGHLMLELLWAAIGAALLSAGIGEDEISRVAAGFWDEKRAHFVNLWVQTRYNMADFPLELVSWISSH
ncbi:MAG: hypothetical protein ACREJD_11925 [Phycisphaerales bacterium]